MTNVAEYIAGRKQGQMISSRNSRIFNEKTKDAEMFSIGCIRYCVIPGLSSDWQGFMEIKIQF